MGEKRWRIFDVEETAEYKVIGFVYNRSECLRRGKRDQIKLDYEITSLSLGFYVSTMKKLD